MKILILAEGQLGDLLLLTPAVRSLRNGHPDARITVLIFHRHRAPLTGGTESGRLSHAGRTQTGGLAHAGRTQPGRSAHAGGTQAGRSAHAGGTPGFTGPPDLVTPADGSGTSAVMTLHPCVDEVLEVDRPRLRALHGLGRLRGELSVLKAIRARRFDTVLCTFPEDRFAVLAFLSGASVRVGQKQQSLSWLLNRRPSIDKKMMGVREYYCALAESAGGIVESRQTEFRIPASADAAALQRLSEAGVHEAGWVAVHPGASGDYKIWPPERFAALLAGLQRHRIRAVLLGGTGDGEILEAIRRAMSNPVPVIRTGTDVALLGALLRRSALCITNDSGPRHLAVAVQSPSLALFRQFHGIEWKIYPESAECATMTGTQSCSACPPSACLDRTPGGEQYGAVCLRQLGAEEVLGRALDMIAGVRHSF
ncbi:MAG: ADP-heptose--LPS heptosyltransferase [Bacteroidetes bacterium]|nr:ADP-heptose--LPS heptosyltransferase [Bacteroidota bacterium]